MKKLSAIVLASVLLLMQIPMAFAFEEQNALSFESVYAEAGNVINVAVQQGIVPGQESGQISELYMAESVPVFELCADGTLAAVNTPKYYPVLDQSGTVRGLIIAALQEGAATATVEYNTAFATEMSEYQRDNASICFVFDQTGIYVYDGSVCVAVMQGDAPDASRGEMDSNVIGLDQLQRTTITAERRFDLLQTSDPPVSGMLNVPIVVQDPWENGCWAATAVSVGRYSGTMGASTTIDDIMEDYAGGEDIPKSYLTVKSVLNYAFGVSTTVTMSPLMMTTVIDKVGIGTNQGDPILARVAYSGMSEGHFIVVCGYTSYTYPNTSYITMMDPLSSSYRTIEAERVDEDSEVKYTSIRYGTTYYTNLYFNIV